MLPPRMRAILTQLHWSMGDLAAALDCSPQLVRKWSADTGPLPPSVGVWLEALAAAHHLLPPPVDFRRPNGRPPRGRQRLREAVGADPAA
jgi:hypothetical protein